MSKSTVSVLSTDAEIDAAIEEAAKFTSNDPTVYHIDPKSGVVILPAEMEEVKQ